MRRLLTAVLLCITAFTGVSVAQWSFFKPFPYDTATYKVPAYSSIHGLAVDPAGKVWIQPYGATDSIQVAGSPGVYKKTRAIYVFNKDGTPASFSPIRTVTIGTLVDTLDGPGVGLRADNNGNILVCRSYRFYRVNYQTGAGMNKYVSSDSVSWIAPGVDAAGNIFLGTVLPGYGVRILTSAFAYQGNVIDTSRGYCRSCNVSSDGNTFYYTSYSQGGLVRIISANGTIGPYVPTDTLLKGMAIESSCWNKKGPYLWVSSGGQSSSMAPYTNETWYAFDPASKTLKDSINWNQTLSPGDCRPRAIAFSVTGDTAYVGEFNTSGVVSVQMFRRNSSLGVEPLPNSGVPATYSLDQNYPNPFNPTTEIRFTLGKPGFTTLRVFDMLGREVAELVNQDLTAGTFKAAFDASRFSSGTYVYELRSGDVRIAKKMMLLK